MKNGNWIPVDKGLVALLPKDRPFTDIEAYISLRVDIDNLRVGNVTGYAGLWGWSRGKVRRFLKLMERKPDGTSSGQVRDRKGTGSGHPIRLIFNNLQEVADGLRTGSGQVADR